MQDRKATKVVLWYVLSVFVFVGYGYLAKEGSGYSLASSLKRAAFLSLFVVVAVSFFDLHNGIDYVLKVPKFVLMLLHMLVGYLYDLARKIFDRKYIIVARPLGWRREDEERRHERLQKKASRIGREKDVLDGIHELRVAQERQQNIELDLECQRLGQHQELQRARYLHAHGEEPSEETLKMKLLQQELEHREQMNQLELEQVQRSRNRTDLQLPGPSRDDDDDVVY